jgi:hypothetical protein
MFPTASLSKCALYRSSRCPPKLLKSGHELAFLKHGSGLHRKIKHRGFEERISRFCEIREKERA